MFRIHLRMDHSVELCGFGFLIRDRAWYCRWKPTFRENELSPSLWLDTYIDVR